MNGTSAMDTITQHETRRPADHVPLSRSIDWAAQVRLAVVLSLAAAIVAIGLADRVADQVLVIGSMVVASIVAWHRVDRPDHRPARVPSRRH